MITKPVLKANIDGVWERGGEDRGVFFIQGGYILYIPHIQGQQLHNTVIILMIPLF